MLGVTRSGDANRVSRGTRKSVSLGLPIVNRVEDGFDTVVCVVKHVLGHNWTATVKGRDVKAYFTS